MTVERPSKNGASFNKKGAKFTSLTIWGTTDELSWRGPEEGSLLFGTTLQDKKEAYYRFIEAAYSV